MLTKRTPAPCVCFPLPNGMFTPTLVVCTPLPAVRKSMRCIPATCIIPPSPAKAGLTAAGKNTYWLIWKSRWATRSVRQKSSSTTPKRTFFIQTILFVYQLSSPRPAICRALRTLSFKPQNMQKIVQRPKFNICFPTTRLRKTFPHPHALRHPRSTPATASYRRLISGANITIFQINKPHRETEIFHPPSAPASSTSPFPHPYFPACPSILPHLPGYSSCFGQIFYKLRLSL